jgi:prepilin-type N-terminal cleavage/methylation domain-containing protein
MSQRSMTRPGMTLIELLVVIAIIGVLVGMLLPAVQMVRNSARRAQCLSQLHNIGVAMENYMDTKGERAKYPDCARMPSISKRQSLVTTLGPFIERNSLVDRTEVSTPTAVSTDADPTVKMRVIEQDPVFACPGDSSEFRDQSLQQIGKPPEGKSYYDAEGLSYEYNDRDLAVKTRQQVLIRMITQRDAAGNTNKVEVTRSSSTVWISYDFEAYHGNEGDDGSRCFVYMDGHADSS